jgi:hypothetical protein
MISYRYGPRLVFKTNIAGMWLVANRLNQKSGKSVAVEEHRGLPATRITLSLTLLSLTGTLLLVHWRRVYLAGLF